MQIFVEKNDSDKDNLPKITRNSDKQVSLHGE